MSNRNKINPVFNRNSKIIIERFAPSFHYSYLLSVGFPIIIISRPQGALYVRKSAFWKQIRADLKQEPPALFTQHQRRQHVGAGVERGAFPASGPAPVSSKILLVSR